MNFQRMPMSYSLVKPETVLQGGRFRMTDSNELTGYRYHGGASLVILHEQYMRKFMETWKIAGSSDVPLPRTDDPTYRSYSALLRHVFHWARKYMIWMCESLELPNPEIRSTPDVLDYDDQAESHLEHLLAQWRTPLAEVDEKRFYRPEYAAPWGTKYCIDAMLEHAVMHPLRHRFQLLELMKKK